MNNDFKIAARFVFCLCYHLGAGEQGTGACIILRYLRLNRANVREVHIYVSFQFLSLRLDCPNILFPSFSNESMTCSPAYLCFLARTLWLLRTVSCCSHSEGVDGTPPWWGHCWGAPTGCELSCVYTLDLFIRMTHIWRGGTTVMYWSINMTRNTYVRHRSNTERLSLVP